jgi:outer membrane protein OmpA-like peptidoglycan-associated protein
MLSTTGCHHKHNPSVAELETTPPSLRQQIQQHGAQIIQQGTRLQIILPTDQFFRPQSTEIKSSQTETMDIIAIYLKSYLHSRPANRMITVSGYTDTVYTPEQRHQLSAQYAQVVASYLWNQGFSPRQLKVVGYGATKAIASTRTPSGSSYNRRVVIEVLPK